MAGKPERPATSRKSSYALPARSGKWNFVKATGTLNLKGVLSVAIGKLSVKIKSVTFKRPAKGNGQLTVKLAGESALPKGTLDLQGLLATLSSPPLARAGRT